ncbi:hypothetical protein EXIGLDRAFT_703991 [Exidia glandulosa HHB12029]|uniref:Uncharacterized protein n=1 Tax=Exidia glandulosa HHB12029 TaxID=1314781 RepID=A0A166B1V5_EXIGL|nr:hypothetical protein EXIGLDRAFT_703991 [Exidia glandulosa HHB12029]
MTLEADETPLHVRPLLEAIGRTRLDQLRLCLTGRALDAASSGPFHLSPSMQELDVSGTVFALQLVGCSGEVGAWGLRHLYLRNGAGAASAWVDGRDRDGKLWLASSSAPAQDPPVLDTFRAAKAWNSLSVLKIEEVAVSLTTARALRGLPNLERLDFHPSKWVDWWEGSGDGGGLCDDFESGDDRRPWDEHFGEVEDDSRLTLSPREAQYTRVLLGEIVIWLPSLTVLHVGGFLVDGMSTRLPSRTRCLWVDIWSRCAGHPRLLAVGLGRCGGAASAHRHVSRTCQGCRGEYGFETDCYEVVTDVLDVTEASSRFCWQKERETCVKDFTQLCSSSPFAWSTTRVGLLPPGIQWAESARNRRLDNLSYIA